MNMDAQVAYDAKNREAVMLIKLSSLDNKWDAAQSSRL
jgi:hypothetical protein